MRVRWTAPAAKDLYNITRHIRRDKPSAAREVAKTVYDACAGLESFPYSGRHGRIPGTRELVLAPLPYIVVYRIKEQTVEIARIYHGAQDWP